MKDLYYPRYSIEVPKSSLSGSLEGPNLAFVRVPKLDPVSPSGNICLIDRSYKFPENTSLYAGNVVKFNANIGINDTNNILVTNKYSNTHDPVTLTPINRSALVRPLWYQYRFLVAFPLVANPNGTFTARLIDNFGVEAAQDHILIDDDHSKLYTDIVNTPDKYYTVVYNSTSGQVAKLLSTEPYFKEVVSFSVTGAPEYSTQYDPVLSRYQIRTQQNPTYMISMLTIGTTRIHVKHSVEAANTEPWYVNVSNGYFKRFVGSNTYEYGVPEYYAQPFNPMLPFEYRINETPIFVDNNLLRLRHVPLGNNGDVPDDVFIYIRFSRERTDTVNYTINSTGETVDLNPYSQVNPSTVWCRIRIEDIDRTTGLVKVAGIEDASGNLLSTIADDNVIYRSDTLVAFYYYQQKDLIFQKISLNPVLDRSLLTHGVSIYATPMRANIGGAQYLSSNTVDYLLFDENEVIIGASDSTVPLGETVDEFFAVTDGSGIPQMFHDRTTFLELARVFVRNTAVIRDITDSNLVDTRILGGNILDPLPPEVIDIININTNGLYYLRYWAGIILPGNSVVVVKLPSYLLNDNYKEDGTLLTDDELIARQLDIRRVVKKHIASGVLPLVRFYDNVSGEIDYSLTPPLDRIWF